MTQVFVRMVSAKFQNQPTRENPDHIFQFTLERHRLNDPKILGTFEVSIQRQVHGTEMLGQAWEQAALTLEKAAEFARKAAEGAKTPPPKD